MALTPQLFDEVEFNAEDVVVVEVQPEPSRTWRIDIENGRISGFIDGEEALRQFIRKAIGTARNRYVIYDGDYGSELDDLIGQTLSPELMETEIPRLVRETIAYDDRIADVTSIEVERIGSDAHVSVTVETALGEEVTEGVVL